MDARNDLEDQENDPELIGDSYAIEIVLETLSSMMTVRSAVIRSRACELTGLLLIEIPQEYELTLPLITNMTDSLIVRANDTSSHVRLLALDAMTRLQNFRERDCKVIAQYMKSMRSEPVAENRAMAVKRCSLNKETLLDTIDRCLDVDVNVRAEALKKIAGKVKHHVLTSAQVLSLLKHGLEDEDQVRQIVVSNLIPSWLAHIRKNGAKNEKGNIIDLVISLEPSDANSFETARDTIEVVFDQWSNLEDLIQHYCKASERLVTSSMLPNVDGEGGLGTAVAFTWYHLIQRAVKLGDAEQYMPQFPEYCDLIEERARKVIYIREQLEAMMSESSLDYTENPDYYDLHGQLEDHLFELKWLIKALPFFEISLDPMNREKLKSMATYIVVQMFPEDLQAFSESLAILVTEVAKNEKKKRNDIVKELVEELREQGSAQTQAATGDESQPSSTQITEEQLEQLRNEIAEVQMKIHQLQSAQQDAIEEKNFAEASRLEEEMKPFKAELDELRIKKNQTKRLPSTINETAENEEHRFTYSSATKALIVLNGHMSRLKKLELGLDQFVKILVVPVLMKISMGEMTGEKQQPMLLQEQAIKFLGLVCSLNMTFAKEYFAILVFIAQNEVDNVIVHSATRCAAINSIIDLSLIYDHELTKDLDTTQLDSILQSTNNESTCGDTVINASTVIEDGPQATCAKLLVRVLRERRYQENKEAHEIAIDGLVSLQLAHRTPSAALQLQVLLYICSKEYHGHDMADYRKAMMRIVLNEEAFKMLESTLRLGLRHVIANQDNLADLDGASAERLLPLIFTLANPDAFHKASDERIKDKVIDVVKIPLRLTLVILETVKEHFHSPVTWGILKLCKTLDVTMPLQLICDENKFEETLPLREDIYRIIEVLEELETLIKERHAKDAVRALLNNFQKQVRVIIAVEQRVEEIKQEEQEKKEKAEKAEKKRKSKGKKKSLEKVTEEEIEEGIDQINLSPDSSQEPVETEQADIEASSSGAELPVPAKKAKKTPAKKARSSRAKSGPTSSQSANEESANEMEPPQIIPKERRGARRSRRTKRNTDSQESS